ncbi:hypothetical protein M422DRAFT_60536 [Sphaerobolus stellatus SS14]|uniref:Carboxypeptidase n=1 Tax=Sphaerobolus stellatus (strain SS14) TaxID=990650 RepID=A0A0C9UCX4_SPHS4|nr:hypothetical protein M422DRAFT_60536 [Sphaerobolus stellatus SS14]
MCRSTLRGFTHAYPGIPNDYIDLSNSIAWQNFFLVKDNMSNVTFSLPRSFAGNIPMDRPGHPNDTFWIIWLNGGPGSSSLAGLFLEVASDFVGFLNNLGQVLPSLRTRPLYIIGESYAGKYIPYIMKSYFGLSDPPVRISKFAIGDGTISTFEVYRLTSVIKVLETYSQIIDFDPEVFDYFREQAHLCWLDINLSYPQPVPIPTIVLPDIDVTTSSLQSLFKVIPRKAGTMPTSLRHSAHRKQDQWKRDLSGRANGTIDHGMSVPNALSPEIPLDASVFLNDPTVKSAVHAPIDKDWSIFFDPTYPSGISFELGGEPIKFLSELAANITAHNMLWILYSSNDDSQDAHFGTESKLSDFTSYNTTFGGVRGFTRRPSTPWFDDSRDFAGIVHQERGLTYVLFDRASHQASFFVRKVLLGDNLTGTVIDTPAMAVTVVWGENQTFANGVIAGEHNAIFYGSGTTQFSTVWPSATIAAWDSFITTATAVPTDH